MVAAVEGGASSQAAAEELRGSELRAYTSTKLLPQHSCNGYAPKRARRCYGTSEAELTLIGVTLSGRRDSTVTSYKRDEVTR